MNLILRPLNDVNDVTWSIIWCMVILLFGVAYYIAYIMKIAYQELEDGEDAAAEQEELLQLPSSGDQS